MKDNGMDKKMNALVGRALEIMGGRERAFAVMEAEFDEMKRRWNQDVVIIGRILRAHLHVEHYLTLHLRSINPNLGNLDQARLSFAQKVELLHEDGYEFQELVHGIRRLNKIRNRLAHNLEASVTVEDADVFLSQPLFKAMREHSAEHRKNEPSSDPINVLEDFAEYASARLHSSVSEQSQAFRQAMSEMDGSK